VDRPGQYGQDFYSSQREGSRSSARVIVPLIVELLDPRSVVDVGCGLGTWLAVFARHGINDLCGIDGEHVDRSQLEVPESMFVAQDLSEPLDMSRRYDLAVCLEVAEHLSEPAGRALVKALGQIAPAVLFSAAIPLQGGTGHVNERWQAYWAALFRNEGLFPVDCIRPVLWSDDRVDYWYRQNALLYATIDLLRSNDRLAAARERTNDAMLSLVHPRLYMAQRAGRAASRSRWRRAVIRIREGLSARPRMSL
jgi:SAM-dependent methyltransferase